MTRQDIEWKLRPSWPAAPHALVSWLAAVIVSRDWCVRYGECFAAFRKCSPRVIEIPGPVVSDEGVAQLLHEMGHLLDPQVRPRKPIEDHEPLDRHISIEGECAAWLFAEHLAGRKWTATMQATLVACLMSYRDAYAAPCSMPRRLISDTVTYTQARLRRRGVVSLQPGGPPPVPVPAAIAALVSDLTTATQETSCPR